MSRVTLRTLAVAGLSALLIGCGFQLRGWDAASAVESAYLTSTPRNAFEAPLRRALRQAGIAEAASAAEAEVVVNLLEEWRDRRSVSVSPQVRAAEYEVAVAVRYSVTGPDGRELIAEQWLERQRVYRVDSDNILGTSEEQALLEREMEADLVQQIVRSLNAAAASASAAANSAAGAGPGAR
jgi:LPS-assembly lipoprotein